MLNERIDKIKKTLHKIDYRLKTNYVNMILIFENSKNNNQFIYCEIPKTSTDNIISKIDKEGNILNFTNIEFQELFKSELKINKKYYEIKKEK